MSRCRPSAAIASGRSKGSCRRCSSAPSRSGAPTAWFPGSLGQLESLRPKVAAFHRPQRATIAGWIEAGLREGTIGAEVDADREAALFLGMLRGASYQIDLAALSA